jgi:hypothetical protein
MKFSAGLTLVAMLAACSAPSSDEERVRDTFATVERAAEARDASDVLEHVALSYADSQGNDKAALQAFLRGYFLANPRVEVLFDVESLELPVAGLARGRVDLTVLPAGDRATLDVELREQDGEWRVTRADRVRPGD